MLRYQTSHGALTLEEMLKLDVDPMFYVRASDNAGVHPKKRKNLQMDFPKHAVYHNNLHWQEITFNNDETMLVPVDREIMALCLQYNRQTYIAHPVLPEEITGQTRWKVMFFSRVRRSAKYCQIRSSEMPPHQRLWEHRFVYENWYRENIEGYEIHHKDENPYNNCPENLEKLTRSDHAKHTGQHQTHRHALKNLDGSFISSNGKKDRRATVPQPMPEYLKTMDVHQYLTIKSIKDKGQLDKGWMDLNFVDPYAAYVVNSLFFVSPTP